MLYAVNNAYICVLFCHFIHLFCFSNCKRILRCFRRMIRVCHVDKRMVLWYIGHFCGISMVNITAIKSFFLNRIRMNNKQCECFWKRSMSLVFYSCFSISSSGIRQMDRFFLVEKVGFSRKSTVYEHFFPAEASN